MNSAIFAVILLSVWVCNGRVLDDSAPTTPTAVPASATASPAEPSPSITVPNIPTIDPGLNCNLKLLKTYGLSGQPHPSSLATLSCPKTTQTCCTQDDDAMSLRLWEHNRVRVEQHYNVLLLFMRYTLGFADEVFKTAAQHRLDKNQDCKAAANDYLNFGIVGTHAEEIYNSYVKKVMALAKIRSGFYCSICDAEFHKQQTDFWVYNRDEFRGRVYWSSDSCSQLVDATIEASYYEVTYFKRYLEDMVGVFNCKTGLNVRPQLKLDFAWRQKVKNCFFYRKKGLLSHCIDYCREFRLSQKSPLLDGDLNNLGLFFQIIANGRAIALQNPNQNSLTPVAEAEDLLAAHFPKAVAVKEFFDEGLESTGYPSELSVGKFQGQFVMLGGASLYTPVTDHKYPITIKWAALALPLTIYALILAHF